MDISFFYRHTLRNLPKLKITKEVAKKTVYQQAFFISQPFMKSAGHEYAQGGGS